ncbi:MAG TPA: hypothetical protein VMF90_18510 [Rhizobiaceae bacterium]|nr:hypothetical protein [Rhizobiaceae bacterium]
MPNLRYCLPVFLLAVTPAAAADRWEAAAAGAVATLPAPNSSNGIEGGSLFCAEQKWAFYFNLAPNTLGSGVSVPAKLTISGKLEQMDAKVDGKLARVPVPNAMLEPLKAGNRLAVEIGPVETGVTAIFNLNGSRRVIDEIGPKCSPIDMSGYDRVVMSETDVSVEDAKRLVAEEMKVFQEATNRTPVVSSRIVPLPQNYRLLFASVCGSTNYYGPSGCNLTGYASFGGGVWQEVYDTEGMFVYIDKKASTDGMPNLVTLAVINGTEPIHWVWGGNRYDRRDPIVAAEPDETTDKAQ